MMSVKRQCHQKARQIAACESNLFDGIGQAEQKETLKLQLVAHEK